MFNRGGADGVSAGGAKKTLAAALRPLNDYPCVQSVMSRPKGSVGLDRVACFAPTDSLVNRGGLTRRPVYSAGFLDKSIRLENIVDETATMRADTHCRCGCPGNYAQGAFWGALGLFKTQSNLAC
jgi:hypothetical protein